MGRNKKNRLGGKVSSSVNLISISVLLASFFLPFIATLIAVNSIDSTTEQKHRNRFLAKVDSEEIYFNNQLVKYEGALRSTAGFFLSSENVSAQEFKIFVDELRTNETIPGSEGIGFVKNVRDGELDSFISESKSDGIEDLTIKPNNSSFSDHFIIKYIEPTGDNSKTIGLNLAFEKNRYDAAKLSRDTKKPAITGPIILLQDKTESNGLLIFYPIYKSGSILDTVEQRREANIGWIFTPVIDRKFLESIVSDESNQLEIEVFDGDSTSEKDLIYDGRTKKGNSKYTLTKTVDFFQHTWTFKYYNTNDFESALVPSGSKKVFIVGVIFSFLAMFFVIYVLRRNETIEKEVKKKTKQLSESELRFALAIDGNKNGIWDWQDITKDELYWSPRFKEIIGFKEDEIEASVEEFSSRIHPEDLEESNRSFAEAIENNSKWNTKYRLKTKSGEYRWFSATGVITIDENTNVIRATGSFSDIDELIRMQNQLKLNEERLSVAISGANTGIWDWQDVSKDNIYYSPQFHALLGYSIGEFGDTISSFFEKVLHDDSIETMQGAMDEAIEKVAPFDITFKAVKKYGEIIWLHAVGRVVLDEASGVKRLSGFIADVTELTNVQEELKFKEERLALAVEGTQVGLFDLFDVRKDEGYLSPQWYEMLGYEIGEIEPKVSAFSSLLHPDDLILALPEIYEAVRTTTSFDLEYRLMTKSGSYCWVQAKGIVTRDSETKIKRITGSIADISERKNIERIKNEFISVVSHELRTPLTSISGSLGLVLGTMSESLPEKTKKMLEIAKNNSVRLGTIVNDILDMDKMASGKMEFNFEDQNVVSIVETAMESTVSISERSDIEIVFENSDNNIISLVDSDRLQQVIINLLSNAIKFSSEGSKIIVSVKTENYEVKICVEDFGEGIPEKFRKDLFTKFSQADGSSSRKQSGSGLGLYICKSFIEKMNGDIGFESKESNGSIFWITLPLSSEGIKNEW